MKKAPLRNTARPQEAFLAALAHELRSPLAPIHNSLEILRLSAELSPAMERVRAIMEQQVHHLSRLIEDLSDVSRVAHGKIELRKEPVQLAALVSDAVEISRPLIEAAGHQLAIAISAEPMLLEADPVRIVQVMVNLLNNAAKYTERQGKISLTVRQEGNAAVVSVRDNGLGITTEMLSRVFGAFNQVDATRNRAQGGLGMGLTIARSLVELHGGQIEARSAGLGSGSEFVVRLPLLIDLIPCEVLPTGQRRTDMPTPSHRVLVVDDMRDSAYILATLLKKMGHRVRIAHDAESALEELQIEAVDVLLSDIGMPGMNGHELARRVREQPAWKDVLLVAMTGYGQDIDRQQASAAGFDHHLVKPVNLTDLEDLLASVPALARTDDSSSLAPGAQQDFATLGNNPCLPVATPYD